MAIFKVSVSQIATLTFLGLLLPTPAFANCGVDMPTEAQQKFANCISKMSSVVADKALIIDADTDGAFEVNTKNSQQAIKCFKIGVGDHSAGGSGNAQLGNGDGSNMTPPGMLLTYNKTSSNVFSSTDQYVGLQGTNHENSLTEQRGVLLHSCNGMEATHGCICFQQSDWPEIKKLTQSQNNDKGTPIFVYSKSMKGDGCSDGSVSSGAGGGSTSSGTK
jgi:hypothetical protein